MEFSPPTSPSAGHQQRPSTGSMRPKRSSSRMSLGNKNDTGTSRKSDDEDAKTAVKVGKCPLHYSTARKSTDHVCLAAVRVRPPLRPNDPGYDLIPQRFRESTCEVTTPTSLTVQSQQGKKLFIFDRVFGEDTEQEGIWDYLSDSVDSFVQGYNVSILAYGQSGSGKSYTMGTTAPELQHDPSIMGVVPRAATALFEKLNSGASRQSGLRTPQRYSTQGLPTLASLAKAANADRNWQLKATYVEIYNEQLRDLLVPDSVPVADRAQVSIREDTSGRILLTGMTQVNINSVEDLLNALHVGSAIRQTDATNINAKSSRSHAVFSLNLIQKKGQFDGKPLTPQKEKRFSMPLDAMMTQSESVVTVDSKLHFVDLAGSERLKNTGAQGDRAKEGISINAGLASLGKVISQLSSRQPSAHISYRDSRLTRLLQDSLGGNAITYMVACITPAQFHLSETLNTVTYAQRARAIQSRPEIQQSHDETDKQAAIDRLKAEVSFLRDQVRGQERGDRRSIYPVQDRPDRPRGREVDLQTQLMDMQENYNALSQRHAKLIAEITRARDDESEDTPMLKDAIGEKAVERLNRSNSFAEAVEQVVLEYEKTIQSLESNLSNTRASLSHTESTVQEKETRISYMETIQQQLQARVQKAMDRETSNETYLRDLESRMDGAASGEEQNAAIIIELRKELSRVRESETSAEDYISTLEERLAEAEQDQEIMQREIDRLEHVVERQRSIGRLDNLLSELDTIRQTDSKAQHIVNGHHESVDDPFNERAESLRSTAGENNADFVDAESDLGKHTSMVDSESDSEPQRDRAPSDRTMRAPQASKDVVPAMPSQNDFMADKLENLTQELFDLRSEHETTVTDYDNLQQKYQTALETLAKLEYDKETPKSPQTPTPSRPQSFLASAGMEQDGQQPSSRSLSSELSSHGQLPASEEKSTEITALPQMPNVEDVDAAQVALPADEEDSQAQEMQVLRQLHAGKAVSIVDLSKNYKTLAQRHQDTLTQMGDLQAHVQRSQYMRPSSPSFMTKPSLRRKASQDLMMGGSDRANRAFASLRNIALDNFEEYPDTRQNFEVNLNTVMTELHSRSEKVVSLDAELGTVRREMESKMAIITGLTRERSSMRASSGIDFSIVGQMREQLMESEHQIRALHEAHTSREKEFQDQIDSLKASLEQHHARQLPTPSVEHFSHMPGDFPETPALEVTPTKDIGEDQAMGGASRAQKDGERAADIAVLQRELASWETKHVTAMDSMKASEQKLLNTIAELEASMRNAENGDAQREAGEGVQSSEAAAAALSFEHERSKHQEVVDALQREVEQYRTTANQHVGKLSQLEQSYAKIVQQVEEDSTSRDLTHKELQTHRDLVSNLEDQLQVHKTAIATHQENLETLQASHSKEIEGLKTSMTAAEKESMDRHTALEEHHKLVTKNFEEELTKAQNVHSDLLRNASSALGQETDASKLPSQIGGLVAEGKELHTRHLKTTNDLKSVQEELHAALNNAVNLENKIGELKMINEEALLNLQKVSEKERKSSRLVEELEDQLNSNYDSHQAANHRLSAMQTERSVQLEEALQARSELERQLEDSKVHTSMLEVSQRSERVASIRMSANSKQSQLAELKRRSMTSDRGSVNFNRESLSPEAAAIALARSPSQASALNRKSGPPGALPSPPPAIPLPPLPGSPNTMTATPAIPSGIDARTSSPVYNSSPPGSRHTSKDVGPGMSQLVEEQDARIRTIEKHLFAEKQLTATLEEALVDLETSANRTKTDMENWRKKCSALEDELVGLRREKSTSRASLQAVEEEREMRMRAERARQALEQRMMELNSSKKKKKNALNCF